MDVLAPIGDMVVSSLASGSAHLCMTVPFLYVSGMNGISGIMVLFGLVSLFLSPSPPRFSHATVLWRNLEFVGVWRNRKGDY